MDGHRGAAREGVASQNPAYRPAHRLYRPDQARRLVLVPLQNLRDARVTPGWQVRSVCWRGACSAAHWARHFMLSDSQVVIG